MLHGYDGGPHFCPDQLADRAAWAALELKELLEPEVFDALVPADAIARNVGRMRELTGARRLMVVVKANAYGHGALAAAQAALDDAWATWDEK